ncbi:hypothetical protein KBB49_01990 [Candidatus Saccharibacteria bacterium]|nr:hypothetical protein [Candidatus Saccharibacteria bacterium]
MSSEALGNLEEDYWARVKCAERRGISPHDIRHIKAKLGSHVQIEFPDESPPLSEHSSIASNPTVVQHDSNSSRIFDEH